MSGTIVQVWFEPHADVHGAADRNQFYIIETNQPDWGAVCDMLDADRLIHGEHLSTRRAATDGFDITGRRPTSFRGSAVTRCELPRFRYFEDGVEA